MKHSVTLLDAISDRHLFAPWFKNRATWTAWFTFLRALFALPMTDDQLAIYRQCTARTAPPRAVAQECWLVCGRRAGKSFTLALVAVYLACFYNYQQYLAPGERGTVFIIARDRRQARVILRYIRALLTRVPLLRAMITRETAEGFDLDNAVTIEVASANFRSTRGYTLVAVLLDELAFWSTEDAAANPDTEVIAALRPAMATIPTAMLLVASSPYARRGALWEAYREHYGREHSPALVWQADTATMNPTVPQAFIASEYSRDPASAAAEYGAQFRSDIESFVVREVVEACVSRDVFERAPRPGLRYSGFVDPSGGSADSFTLAIAHRDADMLIIDAIREVAPPFSPSSVVEEFASLLKSYGINAILGDKYAALWPVEQFAKFGIKYTQAAKPKSDLYAALLPALNSRRVALLDHSRLINQLISLERRTSRGGRDTIDHAPRAHDDIANAVAGALAAIAVRKQNCRTFVTESDGVGRLTEVDPRTLRPIDDKPARIRWVRVDESSVGAAKGP